MQPAAGHVFFQLNREKGRPRRAQAHGPAALRRRARLLLPVLVLLWMVSIPALAACGKRAADLPGRSGTAPAGIARTSDLSSSGTAKPGGYTASPGVSPASPVSSAGSSGTAKPGGYTTPPPVISAFHQDKAKGENGVLLDLSTASEGYIGVSATSAGRLKFQVLKDGNTYTYDLKSDGTPSIFPLQMEDGMYSFRVLENVSGTKYAVLYTTDETVSIADPYRPYLCANDYVPYTETSACVKKAKELAAGAADEGAFISAVYDFVCAGVTYDREKAKTVQAGYMPVPDETMATGKGICFDYASLAASMLRSQGIPCKVVFGYVSPNEVYHAWNMFYTEKSGWVTAKFEISAKKWNRLDLTFSSNGADGSFIGDGSNYKDVYFY